MSNTMQDTLATLGAVTFLVCLLICLIAVAMLLFSALQKDAEKQARTRNIAAKMLLFAAIGGAIGFGVCAANFTLVLN